MLFQEPYFAHAQNECSYRAFRVDGLCSTFKGIHWQLDKLGLKDVFCLDKNDGESHFAELGSSWPGEAKTWPKIALRYVLRDWREG